LNSSVVVDHTNPQFVKSPEHALRNDIILNYAINKYEALEGEQWAIYDYTFNNAIEAAEFPFLTDRWNLATNSLSLTTEQFNEWRAGDDWHLDERNIAVCPVYKGMILTVFRDDGTTSMYSISQTDGRLLDLSQSEFSMPAGQWFSARGQLIEDWNELPNGTGVIQTSGIEANAPMIAPGEWWDIRTREVEVPNASGGTDIYKAQIVYLLSDPSNHVMRRSINGKWSEWQLPYASWATRPTI